MTSKNHKVTMFFVTSREDRGATWCQVILSVSNCYTPAMRSIPRHKGVSQPQERRE